MQGKKPIIKIYIYLRKIVIHRQIEIACNEFNQKKRIGLKVYNQKKRKTENEGDVKTTFFI
jgi:hypothetical protein